jgi:3-isopropylmalate dehydrogenase
MKKSIAVLPGDGVGPEVVEQAVKVLRAIAERFGHEFYFSYGDIGAIAIRKHQTPLPYDTLQTCLAADAVLFGAVGHPRWGYKAPVHLRPEQGLLQLRRHLGLYANIRPVRGIKKLLHLSPLKSERIRNVDFLIFRELCGGVYYGEHERDAEGAYDIIHYSEKEIERLARSAFHQARDRKRKVTLVDKANVMETSRLWREVCERVAESFPDVSLEFMYIDTAAMQMVLDPGQFDVILTENLFGDILSDIGGGLMGSVGLMASASVGEKTPLFEPTHGSFPRAAGADVANPLGAILSAAMMLDHFELHEEAAVVRYIVRNTLEKGIGTADLGLDTVYSCSQMGDMIEHLISESTELTMSADQMCERVATII